MPNTSGGTVRLKRPHAQQLRFIRSIAPRRVIRSGRRSGKTTGLAILAVEQFLAGQRVLYAAPVQDQLSRFWAEVTQALHAPIDAGVFKKNETNHTIERLWTEQRIKAKTAWAPDHLRGDTADLLIIDEFQLCAENVFSVVGLPMLLDRNGKAVLCYTPPSFRSAGLSKARDPRHAAKMYAAAAQDTSGRWAAFHFTSHDNPHISTQALAEITSDMTQLAYRQEILAEDIDTVPGALWSRQLFDDTRVHTMPRLTRIVVGVDPGGDAGIVVAGLGDDGHGYILEDLSLSGSPATWANQAIAGYHKYQADRIVVETNHGGDMAISTVETQDSTVALKKLWASRGKAARAEPVVALMERGRLHCVGTFPALEDECCSWVPGESSYSPNRVDGMVWAVTELMLETPDEPKRAGTWGRR